MDNPGEFVLTKGGNAFSIAAAGTLVGDWQSGFAGMLAGAFQAAFRYGAGGATVTVYIQTSFDGGNTPVDVAAIQFTTASAVSIFNVSGLTPKTSPVTPSNQSLTPGTVLDGLVGDMWRAVVVSTGTYTGGTLLTVGGVAR